MNGATLAEVIAMVTYVLEIRAISLATAEEILHEATALSRQMCTALLAAAYRERSREAARGDDGSWSP